MERTTTVIAEEGKQDLLITREFDVPLDLLFKAHTEPELLEQWMGTKVLKLEAKKYGSYQFETAAPAGNKYEFTGTFHALVADEKMIRTFEFVGMPFGVQLEIFQFVPLTETTCRLEMHVIYESPAHRTAALKLPFEYGINMAHNRLQEIIIKTK